MELLIVMVVVPIIVGGLAVGLLSVFSLQSSVASRLSNTEDSQMVEATYRNDVQSAAAITTKSSSNPQCGSGHQLLGLEWDLNQVTGDYESVVSYSWVQSGSAVSLERLFCTLGSLTPTSTTTLSYNLQAGQSVPTIYPASEIQAAKNGWITAQLVTDVEFSVLEPQGKTSYQYTLEATPATNQSVPDQGQPLAPSTSTSCNPASPGSGPDAGIFCLIDFTPLSGPNLYAAEENCLEMSVTLPGKFTMYFCLSISGAPIEPISLPVYSQAFFGNSGYYYINGVLTPTGVQPAYFGIPGQPAIYQYCKSPNVSNALQMVGNVATNVYTCVYPDSPTLGLGTTTLTFSNIEVLTPQLTPATGWQVMSADAESTDVSESITWTAGAPATSLNILNDGFPAYDNQPPPDGPSPVGDACNNGNPVFGNSGGFLAVDPQNPLTVECSGGNATTGNPKNGAAIVEALMPGSFKITMVGGGREAVVFGLVVP